MRRGVPALFLAFGWLPSAWSREPEPPTFWGKSVAGWIEVVRDRSSSAERRREATWALGCFGPEAGRAVPELSGSALRESALKYQALESLARIGADPTSLVPPLIERFRQEGSPGQLGTVEIGIYTHAMVPLCRIGAPAVPEILKLLNGPDESLRMAALEALGEIGPAARGAVPALIVAIKKPTTDESAKELRRQAIQTLGRIGPDARAAIPALNGLLGEGDPRELDVVIALDRIGAPPVRKLLDAFLRNHDGDAGSHLIWLGPRARDAAPALREALANKSSQDPVFMAAMLAYIDPTVSDGIPVLIEALTRLGDRRGTMEEAYVPGALARLGSRASAALPVLIARLEKGYKETDLLKTLVQVDPEGTRCVPTLTSALKHEDHRFVATAANCLGLLGSRAKDAVPALTVAVKRDFEGVEYYGIDPQVSAVRAIRRIGPGAKSAIPVLIETLKFRHTEPPPNDLQTGRRDSSAAAAAALALGSLGDGAKAAVPALIEAIRTHEDFSANDRLRRAAALALGQIGPSAESAIPVLRNLIKEEGPRASNVPEFLTALSQLSPDGQDDADQWLEALTESFHDPMMEPWLEGRARVVGALGRTSFESDWFVRNRLEYLDGVMARADPLQGELDEALVGLIENFGRFGVAGRLAIPRLNAFRNHPSPWVRMGVTEALRQIVAGPPRPVE